MPPEQEGAWVKSRKKATGSSDHWSKGKFNCSYQFPSSWNTEAAESYQEIIVIVYNPTDKI